MILNSKRFTLRFAADKYLADIEKLRQELVINRRPSYYLDIRLMQFGINPINVYMAETNLYICGWTGNATVCYFEDVIDPVLHAPPGATTRKLPIKSDYRSLGLTDATGLEISGATLNGAVQALSMVKIDTIITEGLRQKLALLAVAIAEATRFRNISRDINAAISNRMFDVTTSRFWKITHDWEDRSRYAGANVAVRSPGA